MRSFFRRHRSPNVRHHNISNPTKLNQCSLGGTLRFKKSCSYFTFTRILSRWNLSFENLKNILHFQIFKMCLWALLQKFLTGKNTLFHFSSARLIFFSKSSHRSKMIKQYDEMVGLLARHSLYSHDRIWLNLLNHKTRNN